jgi:WD40 repeat protein
MATYLVTTTHRHCRIGEPSGFIYSVDLETGRVTSGCPVIEPPHLDADPNPRGGMRGAKGMAVLDDQIFLANASAVYRFDAAWNLLGIITHPSCATIHDVVVRHNRLWVTSCSNDLVFEFDLDGTLRRHYYLRNLAEARRALNWMPPVLLTAEGIASGTTDFCDPRTHRHETYNGGHINSLCFLPNGDLLVLMGLMRTRQWNTLLMLKNLLEKGNLWRPLARCVRPLLSLLPLTRVPRGDIGVAVTSAKAAILRIRPDGTHRMDWILSDRRVPTHSLCPCPDGTVLLDDTSDGAILHLDLDRGQVLSRTKVTDEFLRGMCRVSETQVLVGSQRDLLLVDLRKQQVLNRIRLSDNPNASIYDIKWLPPVFNKLPEYLPVNLAAEALVS